MHSGALFHLPHAVVLPFQRIISEQRQAQHQGRVHRQDGVPEDLFIRRYFVGRQFGARAGEQKRYGCERQDDPA